MMDIMHASVKYLYPSRKRLSYAIFIMSHIAMCAACNEHFTFKTDSKIIAWSEM